MTISGSSQKTGQLVIAVARFQGLSDSKVSDNGFQLFEVLSFLLDTLDILPELSGLEDILHLPQLAKSLSTIACF
jgi:hypothetical protein